MTAQREAIFHLMICLLPLLCLISCGVDVERSQVASELDDDESVPQPQMITGSHLTSCHWESSQKDITCLITPKNAQGEEVLSFDDVSVYIEHSDGSRVSGEYYHSESTIVNGSLVLSITLSNDVNTEGLSIKISAKTGELESPQIISSLTSNDISPEKPQMQIFSDPDFGGASEFLSFGLYAQQVDFSSLENSISSLKIPEGMAATLCNENKSQCMDLYGNIKNLKSLNGKVSSILVYQSEAFATIFEHFSWGGKSQKIYLGITSGDGIKSGIKNRLSAFHIPEQYQMKACVDVNGDEPCYLFAEDKYSLPGGQNDKFKFLELSKL